jgi:hypothetical protein
MRCSSSTTNPVSVRLVDSSDLVFSLSSHLSHSEGGFGVSFTCVTKDAAFYTPTSRFVSWLGAFSQTRQELWLFKDDLRDSSSWSSSPLILLRDIHSNLIDQYDCKEVCAPSPSQVNEGARARLSSQDGVHQQQETVPLSLPEVNLGLEIFSPSLQLYVLILT